MRYTRLRYEPPTRRVLPPSMLAIPNSLSPSPWSPARAAAQCNATKIFPLIPAYLSSRTNRTNTHIRIASTFNEHHRSPRIHRSASHRIASHSNNDSPRIIPAAIRTPIIHRLPPHARIRWMMIPRRTRMDRPFPLLPPHTGVIRPRDPWNPFLLTPRRGEEAVGARVMYTATVYQYDFATLFLPVTLFVAMCPSSWYIVR
ncbi:hypothetical protein NUW54_g6576 [Trametes sanguinea]|uniref:Uncharacterized protein n=1 Tax=Trametes sanguinea TaxID=158606 RepID=A0ACC1PSV4_9APHY|nr:hypothetical protein NUW54_g6576 [Trametes sanguinea]